MGRRHIIQTFIGHNYCSILTRRMGVKWDRVLGYSVVCPRDVADGNRDCLVAEMSRQRLRSVERAGTKFDDRWQSALPHHGREDFWCQILFPQGILSGRWFCSDLDHKNGGYSRRAACIGHHYRTNDLVFTTSVLVLCISVSCHCEIIGRKCLLIKQKFCTKLLAWLFDLRSRTILF